MFIPSLVSRHVIRLAQHVYTVDLNLAFIHCTFSFRLRLKVDSIQNSLRQSTRRLRGDGLSESEPRTGYDPNKVVDGFNPIVTEQESVQSIEESQVQEIEDKFSLPCNLLSSTQDSIESLATLQEADLEDEQIRALLAPPWYLPEREASAERSQIYHSGGEGLVSSSSQSLNMFGTGKRVVWLSHQKRMGQDDVSVREQPADVSGRNESVF